MIELNEVMKDCIIDANNEYPDLDYVDTVMQALRKYVNIVGAPIEMESDEEGESFLNEAIRFLVDCVLFNLIEKGLVNFEGIDDGEMVFKTSFEFES